MQVDAGELRILAQVGFIAASRGDVVAAQTIFAAVEGQRPTSAAAYVGMALAYLTAGKPLDALLALDRGLRVDGQADLPELHAFRGLVLQLAGRSAESIRALRSAGDQVLARAMLGDAPQRTETALEN